MSNEVIETEEEILVYAEFEDTVNIEKYRDVHVLGINEPNPIIQMDDTFFTGKFEDALGTYMLFEEDSDPKTEDPLFDKLSEKNLKYLCKTHKYLKMEHAYVTPKEGQMIQNKKQETDVDIEPINFNSLQEAIEKFKNHWEGVDNITVDF